MNAPAPAIDVAHLSPYQFGSQSPLWWGMIGILTIETTVFTCLVASYFYLGLDAPTWPPPGVKRPDLLLPSLGTVAILASSFTMHRADSSIDHGEPERLPRWLIASIALALVFLALKVIEYAHVPYRWDSHPYGSIVWTIIGFHGTHVTLLVAKTVVVSVLAWRGYFTARRRLGVTINGLYWHFVVVVWLPLYAVLYWSPRVLG